MTKLLPFVFLFFSITLLSQSPLPTKSLSDSAFVKDDLIKLPPLVYDLAYPINPKTMESLKPVADFIKKHPTLKFEIGCHTDFRGSIESNKQLSEFRAIHIYEFLVMEFGIDSEKLSYKGYGETFPLISEEEIAKAATNEEKAKLYMVNQRTELKVVAVK